MAAADSLRAALEILLNRLLALDPETAEAFGHYEGRVIGLEIRGTGLRLHFVPGRGRIQLLGDTDRAPDALIRATPGALLRMQLSPEPVDGLFRGEVEFLGDTALAQGFFRTLGRIEIDWEELLARALGDPVAHALGRLLRSGSEHLQASASVLRRDVSEYLTEEARLLPTQAEFEVFGEAVERLRDDVERLEARIRRLERALDGDEAC